MAGEAWREPDSETIVQMGTLSLKCQGNKSFNIHQGPRRDSSLLNPQPGPLPQLWEQSEAYSALTPGQVYLSSALSSRSQPSWAHPLWCLPPPGEADGARPTELAAPEPSCCTDVSGGGGGMGVRKAGTLGSSGLSHPSARGDNGQIGVSTAE